MSKGDLIAIGTDGTGEKYSIAEKPKAKHPGGRPTLYSQELANEICSQLAFGKSLRRVCEADDMPEGRTVWRWLTEKPEFSQQYARAKEEAADALADDIQNIADKTLTGEYDPQASRVAIDAYKWTASKLKPKKYGDKLDMTTNGKDLPSPILGGLTTSTEAALTE